MSDRYLNSFALEKVFAAWKRDYGTRMVSGRGAEYYVVPVLPDQRRPMLEILCRILIEQHGYTAEDFNETLCRKIVETSVYTELANKKGLEKWRKYVRDDILLVLGEIFPVEEIKFNKKTYKGEKLDKPKNEPYDIVEPEIFKKKPDVELLDMSKHVGFGKPTDKITEEDILAGIDEDSNE